MAQSLAMLPAHVKGQILTQKFLQIREIQNRKQPKALKVLQLQQSYRLNLVLLLCITEKLYLLLVFSFPSGFCILMETLMSLLFCRLSSHSSLSLSL